MHISGLLGILHNLMNERAMIDMGILTKGKSKASSGTALAILARIDPGKLHAAFVACVSNGHVMQIGATKKGNALIIGVYDGTENDKVYPESIEELDDTLDTILSAYGVDYDTPPPPVSEPTTRPRSRSKSA